MSKRLLLGILPAVILIGLGGFVLFSRLQTSNSPLVPNPTEQKVEIKGDNTYTDESEFYFKYPDKIDVQDVTPDEEVYYSKLNLTSSVKEGVLTITVKDTPSSTLDEWFNQESSAPKAAKVSGATELAGLSAKQYEFSKGPEKFLLTLVVNRGIAYSIEGPQDSGFWEETHNLIADSLVIGKPSVSNSSSNNAGTNIIYEEDEIVE